MEKAIEAGMEEVMESKAEEVPNQLLVLIERIEDDIEEKI